MSNSSIITSSDSIITALGKHATKEQVIPVNGVPYKRGQLIALYQTCVDTRKAVKPVEAKYRAALKQRDDAEVERLKVHTGLKAWVAVTFGLDSPQAAEFGFTLKPRKTTAEAKALGVKKNRATREARHTLGKKQKKNIKGAVATSTEPTATATANAATTQAASTK